MSKVTIYVGLDYHKASIQVCVMDTTGKILANRPCTNQAEALVKLVAPFGHDVHAAIEACPGAANLADELATRHGWIINLAHPGYVARMKQTPDKTDWADARVIADLVRVGYLPKVWLAPEDVRQLRTLTRYRQQLANRRRDTKLRITALLRDTRVVEPKSRRWGRAWMDWFQTAEGLGSEGRWIADRMIEDLRDIADAILKVEHRLAQVTSEDPVVSQLVLLAGVGLVTAWALRGGDRPIRSVHHRQADGAVLRVVASQCLQRPATGRRRPDQGGQRALACPDHRGRPSSDPLRSPLEGVGRVDASGGQARVRGRRSGRQPLDPLAVSSSRGRTNQTESGLLICSLSIFQP